jgi:hypothetical protein
MSPLLSSKNDIIPHSLHRFFWDVDQLKLNTAKTPAFIIERLLDKGDLEAARWVLRTYPKEIIVQTLKEKKDFSPWNAIFWATYLNIPQKEVACLRPSYQKTRRALWPY